MLRTEFFNDHDVDEVQNIYDFLIVLIYFLAALERVYVVLKLRFTTKPSIVLSLLEIEIRSFLSNSVYRFIEMLLKLLDFLTSQYYYYYSYDPNKYCVFMGSKKASTCLEFITGHAYE